MNFVTNLKRLATAVAVLGLPLAARAQAPTQSPNFVATVPSFTPQYAANGSTTVNRVPFMYRATVAGLTASTVYRYTSGAGAVTLNNGVAAEAATSGGAGNPVFVVSGATTAASTHTYSSSQSLTGAVAGTNYGLFTTNAAGSYTGWFGFVPTGNARFAAGTVLAPLVTLATDAAPTTVVARYFLDQTFAVLTYGTTAGATLGTYVQGASSATGKNLVALYDNTAGTGRPLATTLVEVSGVTVNATAGPPVAPYTSAAGTYNNIIPNTNANGVRRALQLSVVDASVVGCQSSATAFAGTASPTGGSATPVAISNATAPLNANNCGGATPSVSIAPTATQNIVTGANGAALTATEANGTATARQWAYGTAAAGPYGTTISGATGASYTPNFSAAGTYYVVVNSTIGGTVYTSNVVQVNVTSASANPLIAVTQTAGGAAQANGSTFAGFASTAVGSSSAPVSFTITNASTTDALAISGIVFAGNFALSGTAPTTVAANGGTATFSVVFSPTATGTRTGSVTVNNNSTANAAYLINLSGTATAAVPPAPTATSYTTTSLLAGIPSNVSVAGTNLSGAAVTVTGSSAGTVTVGTVSGSATTANFTLLAPSAGSFTLNVTTAGGAVTQAFTVATPPTGFFEPFEAATQAGYPTAALPVTVALTSGSYTLVQTLLGNITPAGDRKNQGQALRIRGGGTVTFTKAGGAGTLSLLAGQYATDVATFTLGYRPAGSAAAFTAVAGTPATLNAALTSYTFVLNQAGSVEIQIGTTNTVVGTNPRLNIDDLQVTNYVAPAVPDLVVTAPFQSVNGTYNNVTVVSGGSLSAGGNLVINGTLTVQSGGGVYTDCTNPITGPGSFVLQAGGLLVVCQAAGIAVTGPTGGIQVAGTRSYSNDADYEFRSADGSSVSGPGLPATVRSLSYTNEFGFSISQAVAIRRFINPGTVVMGTNGPVTLLSVAGQGTALVNNSLGGSVSGSNNVVQRATDNTTTGTTGYHHYSSPVVATTLADLNVPAGGPAGGFANTYNLAYNTALEPGRTRPFPTVFGYEQTRLATSPAVGLDAFSKGWFSPAGTEPMTVGRAYSANVPNALVVDFVGEFNTGNVDITGLIRGTDPDAGWHLLGNPYPSPLNWDLVAASRRAGLDGAMYVANSTGPYSGVYRSRANGVGPSPLIVAGSGFFVRALPGQTGALNLINDDRVTSFGAQPTFGRGVADTRPVLALTLANAAGTQADDAYVYLQAGATAAFDPQLDATKLPNTTGLNLTVMAGTERLAISGLPLLTGPTLVPLTVGVPAVGRYAFSVGQLANFGGTNLVLRDNLTGVRTPLTAVASYAFTVSAFSTTGRFVLELNPAAGPLASAAQALAAQVQVYPNPARGRFTLTLPASAKAATVLLTNALGQTVVVRSLASSADANFDTAGLTPGVYTLRLTVADGTAVTRKVVVE